MRGYDRTSFHMTSYKQDEKCSIMISQRICPMIFPLCDEKLSHFLIHNHDNRDAFNVLIAFE